MHTKKANSEILTAKRTVQPLPSKFKTSTYCFSAQNEPDIHQFHTKPRCSKKQKQQKKHEFHTKTKKIMNTSCKSNATFAVNFQRQIQKSATLPWQVSLFRNKVCSFSSLLRLTLSKKDCSQRCVVANGTSISRAFQH